jgi:hypothetical protein
VLGEVAVDPNGQAALVVPLGVGSHSLTASFAGIAPFTASTSAALAETVNQAATTTALAVDEIAGPSVVSLTATLAAVAPGAGTPTGTVTFRDGNTVLGTGTLDQNGQAFLLVQSGLAPGTNSLTASYGGDGNLSPPLAGRLAGSRSEGCQDRSWHPSVSVAGAAGVVPWA